MTADGFINERARLQPINLPLTASIGTVWWSTGAASGPFRGLAVTVKHLVMVLACGLPAMAAGKTAVPQIAMPAAYEGAAATAQPAAASLDRWWLLFNDPVLNGLEDEAFASGPDARTAGARLLEARATRQAQTAATFPSGSIAGNASRQKTYDIAPPPNDLNPTSGVTDTLSGTFNVSWELDLFGRLAVARRVATADAAQARFNIEGTRAALAAAVADTYFQAKGYAIQLADARETIRIQTELLTIARAKAEAGAGSSDQVDRVAGDLAQAKAQADDLEAQFQIARRQLMVLIGRGLAPSADLPLAGEVPQIPPTPAALPADLLARRPDIREAEARLRSELGTAKLRHLAIFPTITLLPALGLSRTSEPGVSYIPPTTLVNTTQTFNQGFWNLAAGVNIPTLDIPKLLYQAKAEDARARETAIAYEKTVQTAFAEAQNAMTNLGAGERATDELALGETRAARAYEGAKARYAEGLDDLTSVLSAEQAWRTVRSALTTERVQTLRRSVQTYKALGGGWASAATAGR